MTDKMWRAALALLLVGAMLLCAGFLCDLPPCGSAGAGANGLMEACINK